MLVDLITASSQVVFAWSVLVCVGDQQIVHRRIGGKSISRRGIDDGLEPWQYVGDGGSLDDSTEIICEGAYRGVHVKSETSIGIITSWMGIYAHDWRCSIDVVRKGRQRAVASEDDHQVTCNEIGPSHMLPWFEINMVLSYRFRLKHFLEGKQAFVMHFFEVFFVDDQDVHARPSVQGTLPFLKNTTLGSCSVNNHKRGTRWRFMEGTSPWGDLPEEQEPKSDAPSDAPAPVSISDGFAPMNTGTMLSGTPEMPTGQLIYLQPPSSAPKVIGILVIIYAVLGLFGNLASAVTSLDMGNSTLIVLDVLNIGIGGATVAGGWMLTNYQRRGVLLLLLTIVLSTGVGVAQMSMADDIYDQMLEDGDLTQEEYDMIVSSSGLVQGIGTVLLIFCGGICGLIVAIPLMISNNGLDDSRLFG